MSVSVNLASIHDKLFQKLKHWRDASANYLEFKSNFNGLLDFSFLTLELKFFCEIWLWGFWSNWSVWKRETPRTLKYHLIKQYESYIKYQIWIPNNDNWTTFWEYFAKVLLTHDKTNWSSRCFNELGIDSSATSVQNLLALCSWDYRCSERGS